MYRMCDHSISAELILKIFHKGVQLFEDVQGKDLGGVLKNHLSCTLP